MWNKLRELITKHWDFVLYSIFGIMTTVVNYLVFFPCYNLLGLNEVVSNCLAWFGAVTFAFITNKRYVFNSPSWSLRVLIREMLPFYGCRLFSGGLETVMLYWTVTQLGYNGNVMKLLISGCIAVINYVGSKLIFRNSKKEGRS